MNKFQETLGKWETPFTKETSEAWADLQPKLNATETPVVKFSWKPMISVAAAAAVIVAVVMIWPKARLIRKETVMAEHVMVELPDHSTANLNASSSITFSEDWDDERTVELNGEAFFEVKKGSKFSVVTAHGIVEVLGTSFDVYSRGEIFRVECRTGRVKVSAGKSEVEITPGKSAELSGKSLEIGDFDLNRLDWQDGEFTYNDEPLQNVFDELERQFKVEIRADFSKERLYTGGFTNKDLQKALELVCRPMNLTYEITSGNQVVITEMTR